ncbi:MAG: 1-acyl-sn-glycerol-3-phosphate acyltransferase [Chloroflexi bacterium]|nr:1-acyl-sn-glycerol-3-phosphate acyltransferase [Chloroflexota bacterium]
MAVSYAIGRGLAVGCFSTFARWEVRGREGVPPRGRLLVVANHQSNADPPVLVAALPRRVWFVAKRELFRYPIASTVLRAWEVHPMDRDGRDSEALRWILQGLEQERAMAIFPEGTRSPHSMRKAHHGAAFVALKALAPILPIGITGTENIRSFGRIPFPFCRITVNIGQPFSLPSIEGKVDDALLDSMTEMIMMRIAALLPEEYRGAYRFAASGRAK